MNELDKTLSLIDNFSNECDKEIEKLPYRFNLLSRLKPNENAHSFLLKQLFSYQKGNDYKPLKSFLHFLVETEKGKFEFDCDKIVNPIITAEKHRVDILITEKNKYAIIIENKIHYAVEQENQIERYIEKCKNIGFKESQIYVLYLTRIGGEPTQFSLNKSREVFSKEKRYLPISFDKHIYTWLERYGEEIDEKEIIYKSAVIQYLSYLEELLQKHNSYIEMNKQLNTFLSNQLGLQNKSALERLSIINEEINKISTLQSQLQNLKNENKVFFLKEWKEQLEKDFPNLVKVEDFESNTNFLKIGVLLSYKNSNFSVLIEQEGENFNVGFSIHQSNELKNEEVKSFLTPIIIRNSLIETYWWYGVKTFSNYTIVYSELKNLIEEVQKISLNP